LPHKGTCICRPRNALRLAEPGQAAQHTQLRQIDHGDGVITQLRDEQPVQLRIQRKVIEATLHGSQWDPGCQLQPHGGLCSRSERGGATQQHAAGKKDTNHFNLDAGVMTCRRRIARASVSPLSRGHHPHAGTDRLALLIQRDHEGQRASSRNASNAAASSEVISTFSGSAGTFCAAD